MATLTLRNVPDSLYESLKAQAARNRRSLNQEVIAQLHASLAVSTPEGRRQAFDRARELSDSVGFMIDHREVKAMIEEGRR